MTIGAQTPPASPNARTLIIATIGACAFFMEAFDSTAIVQVLPQMGRDFSVSPVELSLGLTVYMLTTASMTTTIGWMCDRWGARAVFCFALVLFGAGSALCGASQNLGQFVAARVLQACGAAFMVAVGRTALLQVSERKDLVRAMNLMVTPGLVGTVLGPPLGALIGDFASWRWIFLVNLPIAMAGLALGWRYMPAKRAAQLRRFDRLGFLLNTSTLASLIYGMDRIAAQSGDAAFGAALALAGLALGVLAVRHALKTEHPLVALDAVRNQSFFAVNVGGQFFRLGVIAPIFVIPLMMQLGLGLSLAISGLVSLSHTFGDFVQKAVVTRMIRRYGFRDSLIWSCVMFAVCIGSCAFFTAATPLWVILAVMFVSGLIRSHHLTCHSILQFAEIPTEQMTGASTLSGMFMYAGRSLGIALAAIMLNLLTLARGATDGAPALADFRVVTAVLAVLTLGSLIWFIRLPPGVAADVSGHRA